MPYLKKELVCPGEVVPSAPALVGGFLFFVWGGVGGVCIWEKKYVFPEELVPLARSVGNQKKHQ